MKQENNTIFDDVLRTIQERYPRFLIPLVNDVFQMEYMEDEPVQRLPEEYQKVISKVIADSCCMIGAHIYHLECQSTSDGSIAVRMVEYDFMIGLSHAWLQEGRYHIRFPRSCIIYLRGKKKEAEDTMESVVLEMADGQKVTYRVPIIWIQEYSLDEIFQKKLYIYLPFYLIRYEREVNTVVEDTKKQEIFLEECVTIMKRLHEELRGDETGMYQDMLILIRRIVCYILRKNENLWEKVGVVMGGKVLELPSDKIREALAEGHARGEAEGRARGEAEGRARGEAEGRARGEHNMKELIIRLNEMDRAEDIIRAATDEEYQKQLFLEFGIE